MIDEPTKTYVTGNQRKVTIVLDNTIFWTKIFW